jgi:hypothetical protein
MLNDQENITIEVLFEALRHKIVYYRQPIKPKKLVITFDAHGHDLRDKGFGSDVLISAGYDHIFVSHAMNSQYQSLSVAEFRATVYDIAKCYETFTYGSSLGGYCAVYFAGSIGAKAIAISPRNSAHPSIHNPLFSELEFTHSDIIENPKSSISPTVIYDPFQSLDLAFIKDYIIPAYPDTELVTIPYAGHLIAEALLEIGQLKELALSIIEKGVVPNIELNIANSSYFCAEVAQCHLAKGEYPEAAALLEASLNIRYDSVHLDRLIILVRNHLPDRPIAPKILEPYIKIICQSHFFDSEWYLSQHSDIAADAGFAQNPALHYLIFGASEGRNPSRYFNTNFYLSEYQDVSQEGINPLIHYLNYGISEGRVITPLSAD